MSSPQLRRWLSALALAALTSGCPGAAAPNDAPPERRTAEGRAPDGPRADAAPPPSAASGAARRPPAADPCSAQALGLGQALTAWRRRCQPTGVGPNPAIVRDATELARHATCDGPVDVDFRAQALLVTTRQLSPAGAGFAAYDDGKTVTVVSLQRPPCAGDPRPMPSPEMVLAFALPAGAQRALAEQVCTLAPSCP